MGTALPSTKVYTKDDMERFLDAFRGTAPRVTSALRKARLPAASWTTVHQWRREFPWFAEAMDDVLNELFDEIEDNEFKRARKGKTESSKFLLLNHRLGRERGYGKRTELTGPKGQPINWAELMREASGEKATG